MPAEVGMPAPEFTLVDQDRNQVSLSDLKGRNTLVVFIPFPFTGICDGEACAIRDNLASLNEADANVVIVTSHAVPVAKKWAAENGFEFPVLSDFWPHGATAAAYGCFNDDLGAAMRYTYVLDADGVVRDIINTESLGEAREFDAYTESLSKLS